MITINKSILKKVYKKRKKHAHKGDFGRLLIIGGSVKYTGAPALNALAALASLKTGVDIVEVAAPKRAADIIASFSPNLITIPLKGNYLNRSHLKKLLNESKNKNAFVIGSGISRNKQTTSLVKSFLKQINILGVIDADAIHAIASNKNKINLQDFVLAPHSGEFKALTGITPNNNLKKRIKQVKQIAGKLNTTILLKGPIDIISNGRQLAINKTGSPYMTVGGTGDVLSGILGSLIAQNNNLFNSACASAYINGLAAELSKKKSSLIATDLLKQIEKIVG